MFLRAIALCTICLLLPVSATAIEVGEPAPDFIITDITEGKGTITLSQFEQEKVVLLVFWAHW